MLRWRWARLDQLSAVEWHAIGVLRQAVFIVEQRCPYPDLDHLDADSDHLIGYDENSQPLAYLRLVPPGLKFEQPSLGRVVVSPAARGRQLGFELVRQGLLGHAERYPAQPNTIGAQAYLTEFYRSLGFQAISEHYLEDDIPHLDMRWTPQ